MASVVPGITVARNLQTDGCSAPDRRVGRRAGRRHRGRGDRQDAGHRRAGRDCSDEGAHEGVPPEPATTATLRRPLLPEQILVLTYNVKAARELADAARRGRRAAVRARMTVSNFHSFCQRILTENAADAGLPAAPDVLDGVGQVLLLRTSGPTCRSSITRDRTGGSASSSSSSTGPRTSWSRPTTSMPSSPRSGASSRRATAASTPPSTGSSAQGNLKPLREVRGAYAGVRANERAEARGEDAPTTTPDALTRPPTARPAGPSPAPGGASRARPVRRRTTSREIDALADDLRRRWRRARGRCG